MYVINTFPNRKEMGAVPIHIGIGAVCHLSLCYIQANESKRISASETKKSVGQWEQAANLNHMYFSWWLPDSPHTN